jgi:hypothetical protein
MALTRILVDLLHRYMKKIDRYLAYVDGVYCVEYVAEKKGAIRSRAQQRFGHSRRAAQWA